MDKAKSKVKKAIILAGGKGTRLYPVTLEMPKPLLTIHKKPIINYLIEKFKDYGVQEVAIIIPESHREDYFWWLRRYQNDLGGIWVNLMVEEEPMGTIGYWAHKFHTWTGNESFFLTNGDQLEDINLSEMVEHHQKVGALATIAAVEVPNPQDYGVLVFNGDHIERFLEKPKDPPTNYISSGLYLLEPGIIEHLKEAVGRGEKFLMIEKDLFPQLAADKKLVAYKSNGRWFDCGSISRWDDAIKNW